MKHECVFVQSGSVNPAVGWWRGRLRPPGAGKVAPPAGVCQWCHVTSDLLCSVWQYLCVCVCGCNYSGCVWGVSCSRHAGGGADLLHVDHRLTGHNHTLSQSLCSSMTRSLVNLGVICSDETRHCQSEGRIKGAVSGKHSVNSRSIKHRSD